MKYLTYTLPILLVILFACQPGGQKNEIGELNESSDMWEFADSMDAVTAAPASHIILIENEDVRVLRVVIQPGEKEPMHTHQWKSVMYVEKPARIRYYLPGGKIAFETPEDQDLSGTPEPNWMSPEGLHAVENIDTIPFEALRVELKR